jgi:TetR/AcrR family transcriptional repressor of bet genes
MPKKVDHQLRREDLARAAFRVITKRGFQAATVREIAREAGFTHGSIPHYIKSKDQLLVAASEYSAATVQAHLLIVETRYSGIEAVRQWFWELLPLDEEKLGHWNIWSNFVERSSQSGNVQKMIDIRYSEAGDNFRRLIKRAQDQGEIAPSVDAALTGRTASAIIAGLCAQVYVSGLKNLPPRIQKACVNDWIASALPPPRKRNPG